MGTRIYSQCGKTWKLTSNIFRGTNLQLIWFSTKCVGFTVSDGSFFFLFFRRNFVKSTHHLYRYVVFTIFFSCERKVPWFLLCLTSSPTNFAWNFQIHFSHANCTFSRIFCFCCKKHIKDHKKFAQIFFFFCEINSSVTFLAVAFTKFL